MKKLNTTTNLKQLPLFFVVTLSAFFFLFHSFPSLLLTCHDNMTYSGTSVYFAIASLISCIPAIAGLIARWYTYKWTSILLYFCSIVFLFLSVFFYVSYRLIQQGSPFLLKVLDKLNHILSPIASKLANSKVVGPVIAVIVRANFFAWFMILLLSDQVIRAMITRLIGHHASQRSYCKLLNRF